MFLLVQLNVIEQIVLLCYVLLFQHFFVLLRLVVNCSVTFSCLKCGWFRYMQVLSDTDALRCGWKFSHVSTNYLYLLGADVLD